MSVKVNGLDHLVINVTDVVRSVAWYSRILGMEVKVFDPGKGKTPRTSLVFGNQKINVRPCDADKVDWFTADHEAAGSDDLCFLTSSTPDEVVAFLMQSLERGDFYVLCPDNDTPRGLDEKRIQWNTDDLIKNRSALSRWDPKYKDAYGAFISD